MKIRLVCASFALLIFSFSEAVVDNEEKLKEPKKAKEEYEAEKKKDEDLAIKKIKDAGLDEDKFGKLLTWFRDAQICLRRGTEAKNAAYALSDFDLDTTKVLQCAFWFAKPFTKNSEKKTNLWYERLYNSVAKILLSESTKEAPLLLATKGGDAEGERYAAVGIGIGDTKSFGKTQVKGEKLTKEFKLIVDESFKDLPGTVEKVLKWIEETYDEQLKKAE